MALSIEPIDTPTAPESVLLEMHDYYVAHDAELYPDDPQMPVKQRLDSWRHLPDHYEVARWVLREDGRIVAVAVALRNRDEDLDNGFARIHVKPEHRRRGLATMLAGPVFDYLESDGRKKLITNTRDSSPWEPKLQSIGMKKALAEKQSRLLVSDIDWELMDRWIERAEERATDYELLFLATPIPEEHLEKWCDLMLVMNTAPREDLEFEDMTMSPQKWRGIEAADLARGEHLEGFVAVHDPTGDWVGISELLFLENNPLQAYQGDTGVEPAHRNNGLGRWLKAASIKSFLQRHPEVERIDTENASSNEPMLNINIEMGYHPLHVDYAWQGELGKIREGLCL